MPLLHSLENKRNLHHSGALRYGKNVGDLVVGRHAVGAQVQFWLQWRKFGYAQAVRSVAMCSVIWKKAVPSCPREIDSIDVQTRCAR